MYGSVRLKAERKDYRTGILKRLRGFLVCPPPPHKHPKTAARFRKSLNRAAVCTMHGKYQPLEGAQPSACSCAFSHGRSNTPSCRIRCRIFSSFSCKACAASATASARSIGTTTTPSSSAATISPGRTDLPPTTTGGFRFAVSTYNCVMEDGTPICNNGVQPDIWCEQTVSSALAGQDAVLLRAIEHLEEKAGER